MKPESNSLRRVQDYTVGLKLFYKQAGPYSIQSILGLDLFIASMDLGTAACAGINF